MDKKIFFVLFFSFILAGCASSDVQRGAADQIDRAYINQVNNATNSKFGVSDAYLNASQATKGAVIGGAAGAITGQLTPELGLGPGAIVGAIFGGVLGAYIDAHTTLLDRLENRGVKVFMLGDQIKIIMPSSDLFYCMTPTLRYGALCTLDLVAKVINCMPNMSVRVAAYTNETGSARLNQGLSQLQAESVVRYLWKKCVDTRLMYAYGGGSCKLVEMSACKWGEGNNYRVEISLERLPV